MMHYYYGIITVTENENALLCAVKKKEKNQLTFYMFYSQAVHL